jgi:putative membrane protein
MERLGWTCKYVCMAVLGASAAMSGCAREAPNPRGAESAVDALPPPPAAPPEASPSAGQAPVTGAGTTVSEGAALAMVAAVDEHEIAAAEQAQAKQVKGDVLEYANMLHREHSANLEAGKKLAAGRAASNEAAEADAMRKKGREELTMLDAKSGAEYQKAYVDAMVKGHAEVLELLETRLIPAATDEQVRNFLTSSRDHVAMHLDRGKALQSAR